MDWCRFYWGSHGCDLVRGHVATDQHGGHVCSCGEIYEGTHCYGEDSPAD